MYGHSFVEYKRMHRFNRRQVLTTTAVGTGIGLGTGAGIVGAAEDLGTAEDPGATGTASESSFQATTTGGFITIDADTSDGDDALLGPIELGGDLEFEVQFDGEVQDDGTWESTAVQTVDVTAILADIELVEPIENFIEDFSVVELVDDLTLEEIIEFVVDIVDELDLDAEQIDAIVGLLTGLLESIGLPGSLIEGILEDFLADPDEDDIWAILDLLGVETIDDILEMAGIEDLEELDAILDDFFENIDIEELLGDGDIEEFLEHAATFDITPAAMTGAFEPRERQVTVPLADADFLIEISSYVEMNGTFPLDLDLTTGESGDLEGSGRDFITETPTVTVVDNEFVLGLDEIDFGDGDIAGIILQILDFLDIEFDGLDPEEIEDLLEDLGLGDIIDDIDLEDLIGDLLTDEPGRHYLELELEMDFEDVVLPPGVISGTVVDGQNAAFDDATITLLDPETRTTVTTASPTDGDYTVEFHPGSYHVLYTAPNRGTVRETVALDSDESRTIDVQLTEGPPPLPGQENHPVDTNDDGLFEAVRGEAEFTINDVQTLFAHLDSYEVQDNASFYNFSGTDPEEVTIFDVQSQFLRLQNGD